ncbi:hypothetical protein Curi_c13570 [Gottschalkia acidurici 9a]|uniref:Uncharacterized protein n=1 Tax=Gottschalkia acidurici (strain ATCC 7906 / DSM 604 / BCRC 14475 / CIP 104303 / KCTC 5404 / NCIMB 10678 / 9a) TaxID=1128398 RepID=K0B005_GOTA9|nr:DUF6366 family protein [Gottschalkia acidurici]AFS78367.1 hypothetical protein Curi_c13570 [Gottschalkia acidurici 9a]
MDKRDKQGKHMIGKCKKNSMINLSESINRSTIGDLGELTRLGWISNIIIIVIIIGILFFLSKCSN